VRISIELATYQRKCNWNLNNYSNKFNTGNAFLGNVIITKPITKTKGSPLKPCPKHTIIMMFSYFYVTYMTDLS